MGYICRMGGAVLIVQRACVLAEESSDVTGEALQTALSFSAGGILASQTAQATVELHVCE